MSNHSWKISCGGSSTSCLISSACPARKDLAKAKPDSSGLYLKPSTLCPVPRGNNLTAVFFFSSGTSAFENGYPHSILSRQNTPGGNYCLIPALSLSPQLTAWTGGLNELICPPHLHIFISPHSTLLLTWSISWFSQIPIFFCILLPGQTCAAVLQE